MHQYGHNTAVSCLPLSLGRECDGGGAKATSRKRGAFSFFRPHLSRLLQFLTFTLSPCLSQTPFALPFLPHSSPPLPFLPSVDFPPSFLRAFLAFVPLPVPLPSFASFRFDCAPSSFRLPLRPLSRSSSPSDSALSTFTSSQTILSDRCRQTLQTSKAQ
jgi:hypothetical protein